ncbi:MAG: glycosyltransferase [Eubacteriales bacterium]|nr:glycosyltransferase [Eubacteriales bacterium]
MDLISYDLIEKLRAQGSGSEAEQAILLNEERADYLYALSPNRENLFEWYPFTDRMNVLMLGANYGACCELLSGKVGELDVKDSRVENLEVIRFRCPDRLRENGGNLGLIKNVITRRYDAVVIPEITEELMLETVPGLLQKIQQKDAGQKAETLFEEALPEFLHAAAGHLKKGGLLLLSVDNYDALRFLTGDKHTEGRVYAGYENFKRDVEKLPFSASKWYYPLPDARLTKDIFSDAYLPQDGDFRGISDAYEADRYVTCDEEAVYGTLCKNKAFAPFAPAYFVLLSGYLGEEGEEDAENGTAAGALSALPPQIYIRYNRTRIPAYQTRTEILEENGERRVVKRALSEAANDHILSLEWKYKILSEDRETKLQTQAPRFTKDKAGLYSVSYTYLDGITLARKLALLIADGKAPVHAIKEALELVLGMGTHECHNMDCLFENIMVCGNAYYYLDYEWVFENSLDRDYLRYRMLRYWYEAYREALYAYTGLPAFLAAFGIRAEELPEFEKMEESFQQFVHGDGQQAFIGRYRREQKTLSDMHETERKLAEFTDWNLRLQDEVREHKETISKNLEVLRLTQNHVLNIEEANRIHERDIAAMLEELAYLRKHEGMGSRLSRSLHKAFLSAFPEGSRKHRLITYAKNTLRHPVKMLSLYLSEDGRNRISGEFNVSADYMEYGRLTVPSCESPKVSIVLPVYNQIAYTYACVRSIIEHTDSDETPYEIILADDVSMDATSNVEKYIQGLVVSRNAENQGFLKNCNQAAKKARGEYIFFLNNDTRVTDGWLSSLVSMMDADRSIGLAGSKLIYPDGRLQEAGGIIWDDGSGWNYGRLDDPEKPQYNYVKEVDYISGAAIMIRTDLWEEIGGFDERYAPAYCEDSDLAFEVRRHGKRVVYQPKSVVVHFEGISNGTDVNGSGLKKYQLVNQEKFKGKWKAELRRQSKNTGNPNPFAARDRSQDKPCVLIIDHYVPTRDKDAGSKTTWQYIRMLLAKGYNVKFLGDNFLHEEPYSTELMQMGVEILYGQEMQSGIWDWIKENQAFIDIAYLNRPHIAIKYIEFIRDNTDIKCIYYGHDLHFMRLTREYELTGDIRTKREADYWKNIEFTVMRKAEVSYYPSELEVEEIHAVDPEIPVKAITAYLWDSFPENEAAEADYEKREGLLFVGGFAHPPNADGVLWFAKDIFPKLRTAHPEMNFYIAGSKVTDEIAALGEKPEESGIHVLGFVSDEALSELYHKTRLTVVPLRYGAGVKGKVVEALYNGAVVVTTSVGAEGIPDAEKVLAVTNDRDEDIYEKPEETAQGFADAVLKLYGDAKVLSAISRETEGYMKKHYSMDAAWKIVAPDFKVKKKRPEAKTEK